MKATFRANLIHSLQLSLKTSAQRAALGTAFASSLLAIGGCNSEKPAKEISAENSGFRPADSASPAKAPSVNPSSTNPQSPASTAKNDPASTDNPAAKAPSLPSFVPGQADPALAQKSYMTLKMVESDKPEAILAFLGSIDRAMRELQTDAGQRLVNTDVVISRGMDLARMKQSAADNLRNIASTPDQTAKGWIGKLEALAQMAAFKDVPSADELRSLSKQLSGNEDTRVAALANRLQLMTTVIDFQNQAASVDQVLGLAKGLLEKADPNDPSLFMAVAQAAKALDAASANAAADPNSTADPNATDANATAKSPSAAACDDLVNAVEAKYRDVQNPNLGMNAWQMKMQRLPDFEDYLKILDTRQAMAADPAALTASAKSLMEKIPSPWTALALGQCATQFEYSGNLEVAKSLIDIAATQLESTKTPELKEQLELPIKGFQVRSQAIGKPLDLSALVDTQGKPFDKSKYEGKVVLVDFWATWCGPCIQEIPNIKKVYDEKHADGFEVVAINLDDLRSDLDAFMAQQETPWSVFVSADPTKAGMNTPLAQDLSISAIPFTLLIGRDGNVAALHVRGKAIETKVAELLSAR